MGNDMKKDDCIFCKLANGDIPTNAIYEDDIVKAIFDLSPASKGHIIVITKDHFDNVFSIDAETIAHVYAVAAKIATAVNEALECDGMNILQNNGEISGQTVFHFHVHIIPRYQGDSVKIGWTQGAITQEEIEKLAGNIQSHIK